MAEEYTYRDSHKALDKGEVYDGNYERIPWRRFLWSREQKILLSILEKYFEGRDTHLLDFACGTGRITGLLEDRVKTSTAVDVSPSMLAVARTKLKRTEIIEADITTDNVLKGRKFNLITAFRFFVNAEPSLRSQAMTTLAGLLSEDGLLVFNNHHNLGSPWIKVANWRHRQKDPDGIFNVMGIKQMNELVEAVGLEIKELYPIGFFHPPKIPVSYFFNIAVDAVAGRFQCLKRLSESPIAVCTRRRSHTISGQPKGGT
ncbi:MAG: class I SAM-dependent methyltransferase [Phycisphaerales bacterium]|nr:MAG: class I SAM-dependent methyltransferase [Phycisphaerales bacterium]